MFGRSPKIAANFKRGTFITVDDDDVARLIGLNQSLAVVLLILCNYENLRFWIGDFCVICIVLPWNDCDDYWQSKRIFLFNVCMTFFNTSP